MVAVLKGSCSLARTCSLGVQSSLLHDTFAGLLIQWTKGFENPGGVGQDPAKLLREAFDRQARLWRLWNPTLFLGRSRNITW